MCTFEKKFPCKKETNLVATCMNVQLSFIKCVIYFCVKLQDKCYGKSCSKFSDGNGRRIFQAAFEMGVITCARRKFVLLAKFRDGKGRRILRLNLRLELQPIPERILFFWQNCQEEMEEESSECSRDGIYSLDQKKVCSSGSRN